MAMSMIQLVDRLGDLLRYIVRTTWIGIKFHGLQYSGSENYAQILEGCRDASRKLSMHYEEIEYLVEPKAVALLIKCFLTKIKQHKNVEVSKRLEGVKELASILDVANTVLYAKNSSFTSVQRLAKKLSTVVDTSTHLEKEIVWITVEDHDYIAVIFGLNNSYAIKMSHLDDFALQHQTITYFLLIWLHSEWQYKFDSLSNLYDHQTNLELLGFDPDVSRRINTRIDEEMKDMQKTVYWMNSHIVLTLNSYIMKNQLKYVFLPSICDIWTLCSEMIDLDNLTFETISINVLRNLALFKASNKRIISEQELEEKFLDEESQIFYHGTSTSHLSTCGGILRRGIQLQRGSPEQDFSHCFGFYLTNSLDAAFQWGRNKDDEHCVIIFKIPNELLDAQRHGGLEVSDNLDSFLKVVKYFHSYEERDRDTDELEKAKFIKGQVFDRSNSSQVFSLKNKHINQICLKDRQYAAAIENCMCGIIFYSSA